MAVENIYPIKVNTKKNMFRDIPEVVANDNVIFDVEVWDDAVLFPLDPTYTYHLVSQKISRKSVIREGTLNNNLIRFVLGTSEMTEPGKVDATVQIFDVDMKRISTAEFKYVAKKDPSLNGILPTDDKTLVIANESLLTDAIDKANNADARIDNIITNNPQPSEVVDARGGAATLGKRLDDFSSSLAQMTYYAKPTGTADDTAYLQNIFNLYPSVVLKAGTYYIDAVTRLKPPSNRYIEFEDGAILQAKTTSSDQYRVIQIEKVSNVTLVNPVIYGERDTHTGTGGESGHAIVLYTCENIKIYNPICKNCWGDGISIGTGSVNVLIDNPYCDNNRRQGISLIDGKNITINNPVLVNTNGTAPQFGLDIEPSFDTAILENIKIVNPVTKNNIGGGININLMKLAGTNKSVDILIANHVDDGSTDGLYFYKNPSGIGGTIICSNGVYKNNTNRGVAFQNCSAENTLDIKVINPTIINNNTIGNASGKYGSAISFFREVAETETYLLGNGSIINPTIKDTRTPAKISRGIGIYDEKSIGFKNVKIIDPLEVSGITQDKLMDLALGDIKISDRHRVFTHDYGWGNFPMFDRVYTRLINPTETGAQRTITLNQNNVTDYPMTIQNMASVGVKILPKATAKILPISTVAGKSISTTQIGASVTLRHISADIWYVENMIGTWTVEA